MKKILTLTMLMSLSALLTLTSCGEDEGKKGDNSSANPISSEITSSSKEEKEERKLTGSYLTGAEFSYNNFRPTYNYHLTTFHFEGLETYSDGTYVFTLTSMSYSGLNLPEEGNDATGSERENYVKKFYGKYESKVNDLDDGMLDVTLETPTRLTNAYNCQYFVDTAQWNDSMSQAVSTDSYGNVSDTKYTAETYLASEAFAKKTVSITTSTSSFDYFNLREEGEENPSVTVSKETYGLKGAYLSPANLIYMNHRPTYNYYTTTFVHDYIETYDDGTYRASILSSTFSGLYLPEEGNEATGSDRANYIQDFYGTYEAKTNELDETMIDLTLKVPTRAALTYDAAYFIDSANWTEEMSNATATTDRATGEKTIIYKNGEDYLNATKFAEEEISLTTTTASFDYLELSAQIH